VTVTAITVTTVVAAVTAAAVTVAVMMPIMMTTMTTTTAAITATTRKSAYKYISIISVTVQQPYVQYSYLVHLRSMQCNEFYTTFTKSKDTHVVRTCTRADTLRFAARTLHQLWLCNSCVPLVQTACSTVLAQRSLS
jgi:hypothetical protein